MNKLIALWKDEAGLTAVEYAIAGGLVAAVVVAAFVALGGRVGNVINYIVTELDQSPANGGA